MSLGVKEKKDTGDSALFQEQGGEKEIYPRDKKIPTFYL